MTARFFITIDTEEDDWGEFRTTGFSLEGVHQLFRVQEIFDRYGAVPTYLINYPVAQDDKARVFFLENLAKNRCEIGGHCHPWNTPPFGEELNERNSMLCNLPKSAVTNKIAALQDQITKSLGIKPLCFRAGRWGSSPDVAAAIHQLGFRVDTSVTPFIDWTYCTGPDYRTAPTYAYRFNPNDILSPAPSGPLLEVPASIGFLQRYQGFCRLSIGWGGDIARRLHIPGILNRTRLVNLRWLSPEESNLREMLALAKRSLLRGCSYLNMSFHSTTLVPGRSPFVRTQEDLERFLCSIETVVKYAANQGLVFSALSESLKDALPSKG
jgi:hypothetical protein